MATVMIPVVLVFSGILLNLASGNGLPQAGTLRENSVFGGPKALAQISDSLSKEALAISPLTTGKLNQESSNNNLPDSIDTEGASVLDSSGPLSNLLPTREGVLIYKVRQSDTLSKIAVNFDISLNTILWANPKLKVNLIRPGQEIIILPVSGVLHLVKQGETVNTIASLYDVSRDKILSVNPKAREQIIAGEKIIVPEARPIRNTSSVAAGRLPNLAGYFGLPSAGRNWGQLHPENAVDIASQCGTDVFAAAEGLVTEVGSPSSWNSGLGGFITIEHPNHTGTRYAHLQMIFVSVGDYVKNGDKIAEMGSTGNVRGNTGCHLHFEVRGARNPLAN